MIRWPHQQYAFEQVTSAIDAGERAICLTSPTGGGKGRMICDWLEWAIQRDWPAILYTNRKSLTQQTITVLSDEGIPFGVRAAGFEQYERMDAPIQIASLQTEAARVHRSMKWLAHPAKLAIYDEAHLQKRGQATASMDFHRKNDAAILGTTATPIGLSDIYSKLIVAGVTSELRKCGALVPCYVYSPFEFDMSGIKPRTKTGEFSYGDIIKNIWSTTVYAKVIDSHLELNPGLRPAMLFAPGVPESLGFAEEYVRRGIPAAHIDGDDVWVDGKTFASSPQARLEVFDRLKSGNLKVICNRFVMREGIDLPFVYHLITATPIGSVVSAVQIYGRVLRAHPTTPDVLWQDHGGNYWRHGSPNADRDWHEVFRATEQAITSKREEAMREKKEPEPIVCPQCGAVRIGNPVCHKCGFKQTKKSRIVIQKDGKLKEMFGDIFRPRKVKAAPDAAKLFEREYYRAKGCNQNFNQAYGSFFRTHGYWPERNLPLMPVDSLDWSRKVADVPYMKLVPKAPKPVEKPEPALFH